MMSKKIATLGLLKIKVFWNKYYDVVIYFYDVINKNLSRDSNFTVDVVMRPKFGNSRTFMREEVRKCWGLIPTFVEVTGKKLVVGGEGLFGHPPFWIGLITGYRRLSKASESKVSYALILSLHLLRTRSSIRQEKNSHSVI